MSENTITPWSGIAAPSRGAIRAKTAKALLRPAIKTTMVRIQLPDGEVWGGGGASSPTMDLVRPEALFRRMGNDSKIGLGESYMAGDWSAKDGTDLADLLTPFAARMASIIPVPLQKFRRLVDRRLPESSKNSLEGSRRNIEAHYDLSNDLFESFLDPTMSYSAAWFKDNDTLEQAQLRKIDGILDQAGVKEGTRVLEIGTGWGALALRAAQRGARVTTITISKEQALLAEQRFHEAGVEVKLQLVDYREVEGTYDAIVSVEMIEAVGEEYWPTYFKTIDKLLAPGGKVSIQAITMEDHRYKATRNSYGWIQKYIFPGGLIPSLEAIDRTVAQHTNLHVTDRRSLGQDYARTLRLWRETFLANWASMQAKGFDETFRRMWEFYLAYCEAGFRTGYLDVYQLQFQRKS